jgi:DMSO/TMAO reductase YedYZ heme-binding membrane subunit
MEKEKSRANRVIRFGLGCFAWTALGFQTTAMVLIGQALHVFAPGPVMLANYGMAGCVCMIVVTLIGMTSTQKGLKKLGRILTCGGLFS